MATKGMFVDTSICTGCKACQVACKEWNVLDAEKEIAFTGNSYDNTGHLSAVNWRHVRFIEQFSPDPHRSEQARWLFMSDSCKHCTQAGCMEVCPTHAIIRTDLGNVVVQQDTCNGCRNCVAACPYGVISYSEEDGKVHKCTLCNDRIHDGQSTACSKACPTGSIQFGDIDQLRSTAKTRLQALQSQGVKDANIYGDADILGGLNVFYLLMDKPSVYSQPEHPELPQRNLWPASLLSIGGALILGLSALINFRGRGARKAAQAGGTI